MAGGAEGGKVERIGRGVLFVREHRERQAQPIHDLALILRGSAGKTNYLRGAGPTQLVKVVAEVARLCRAASRSGNRVPAVRDGSGFQ